MTLVAGVDAYKKGWVAVILDDGSFADVQVYPSIEELDAGLADCVAIGVDIPIGMPTSGVRQADKLARKFVAPRSSSVFNTPPRAVMEAETYEEARQIARDQFGMGVSSQSYRGLRPKLLEVDAHVGPGSRIFEVHPEVSFRALKGSPLRFNKRSWNGQMERRALLSGVEIDLPDQLQTAGAVPVDDVLDAAVGAWSAARLADGGAESMPDPPDADERGRQVAIWY